MSKWDVLYGATEQRKLSLPVIPHWRLQLCDFLDCTIFHLGILDCTELVGLHVKLFPVWYSRCTETRKFSTYCSDTFIVKKLLISYSVLTVKVAVTLFIIMWTLPIMYVWQKCNCNRISVQLAATCLRLPGVGMVYTMVSVSWIMIIYILQNPDCNKAAQHCKYSDRKSQA